MLLTKVQTYTEMEILKIFPQSFINEKIIFTKSIFKRIPKYVKNYTLKDYLLATPEERKILFDKFLSKKK